MTVFAQLSRSREINPRTFIDLVDPALLGRSGKVFYSGMDAFSGPSPIYVLGLNPGGSPIIQADETIARDLGSWVSSSSRWSAYADESWEGAAPGTYGMAPRVLHLFDRIGMDPHDVPASNVVFVRTNNEAALAREKKELLAACWPVHEAVIRNLEVSTILCLGGTAGRWVRSMLRADRAFDRFEETYPDRHWRSAAHLNADGLAVVTLTHPSRANWTDANADPSPLVKRVQSR